MGGVWWRPVFAAPLSEPVGGFCRFFRGLAIPRLSALFDFVTATNVAFVGFAGLAPFG